MCWTSTRVWLIATKFGLSIQPITGIPYFARRISKESSDGFSPKQIEIIKQADKTIDNIFNQSKKIIVIVFRIGYDSKPPVKTAKLPPEMIFEFN